MYGTVALSVLSVWNVGVLWPNGGWFQDVPSAQATLCYMGTQLPHGKRHSTPPPLFGLCLL